MKKLFITVAVICIIFQVTACGTAENLNYTSEEYLPESDDQPNISSRRNIAEGNGGYYFSDPMAYVYYYDFQSKKSHILCNKPECNHEDETCTAYTEGVSLRYADGYLYYTADEGTTGDCYLWRKSGDGSKTEKLFLLYHMEEQEAEFASGLFCVHRGYVYYFLEGMDGTDGSVLYRRKLEKNAKAEVIETIDSLSKQYDEVYGVGTKVYYVVYDYDKSNSQAELRSYDIVSGKKETHIKTIGITESYYIYKDEFYYTQGDNVYRWNLRTGEEEVLLSKEFSESMYISADDNYLYFDNSKDIDERLEKLEHPREKLAEWYHERCIYVYDKTSLQQVAVLAIPTQVYAYFDVAADNLILNIVDEEFRILDKKEIGTENPEWTTIYSVTDY